jgi:hypothetical protein
VDLSSILRKTNAIQLKLLIVYNASFKRPFSIFFETRRTILIIRAHFQFPMSLNKGIHTVKIKFKLLTKLGSFFALEH